MWYQTDPKFRKSVTKNPVLYRAHTHSLPGATTHARFWPTQEAAFNHLHLWPWPTESTSSSNKV